MAPNGVILASGAAVAVSVAVAAAIALYESPELRRYADDLRRRIAIAMNGMGDGFDPQQSREPVFNRPEDADGFMLSNGQQAQPGVEADEETRRRQREELMYWNSVKLEKQRKDAEKNTEKPRAKDDTSANSSSFDDFLTKDKAMNAEDNAFIFNSGADTNQESNGLRHRGEVNRGIATALLANPFADEYGIGGDELETSQGEVAKAKDEILSDIYSATTRDHDDLAPAESKPEPVPTLIDISEETSHTESISSHVDVEMPSPGHMTPRSEDQEEAFASIQAWARSS